MHSSTATVFIALLLASGSLAAPVNVRGAPGKAPSTSSSSKGSGVAGDVAGGVAAGAASAGLSNLLNEIESHFKREELAGRGIGSTIGKGLASGAGGALLTNGLQEIEGLFQKRAAPGKAPSTTSKTSGAAGDIAGGVAAGAASAGLSNLLNEIESHFKREELAGRGIGSTIGKGLASGAGGALLTNGLQEIEGLFQKRGLGSTIGKGLASGAGGALLTNGLQEIEGLFQKRGEGDLNPFADGNLKALLGSIFKREEEARGLGSTIGKGLASGAGGALLTNGLQEIEGLFQKRGESDLNPFADGNLKALLGSIFKREEEARGLGSTIGKGLASGAGGALLTNGLQEIEGLFQRDVTTEPFNPLKLGHGPVVLSPEQLQNIENERRGLGSTIGKGLASGAGGALLTNGLQEIEGLFQKRGLGSTIGKGLASGAGGALLTNGLQEIEGLFQRSEAMALNEMD